MGQPLKQKVQHQQKRSLIYETDDNTDIMQYMLAVVQ